MCTTMFLVDQVVENVGHKNPRRGDPLLIGGLCHGGRAASVLMALGLSTKFVLFHVYRCTAFHSG